jgi:hypothetical protein
MKIVSAILGVLIVLLVVALIFQYKNVADLQSTLVATGNERDALFGQIKTLDLRITELQKRQAATSAMPAPRPDRPAAALTTPSVEPVATPGVTVTAPPGWAKNGSKPGSYVVGVDQNQTWGGMPSAYVKSLESSVDGFGGMMQTTSADNYIGKRVRLSGWVKTEDANEGGQLWLRIDGQQSGQSLQFDNMNNRAVKGTADWQEASVVLDVPEGATAMAYGFFVKGAGTMWVSGTRIQEVGPEVPSTNMLSQRKALPKAAVNLGFDPAKPK